MSKIICVTLLLIVLAQICCNNTVSSARLPGIKEHIRKCLCKVLLNGKTLCRRPKNHAERQTLIKCCCSKRNQRKLVECQSVRWLQDCGYAGYPISLA